MPVVVLGAFFAALVVAFVGRGHGVRQSFLYASAAHTLCLVVATELLSVCGLLRPSALLAFWAAATALAIAYAWARTDRETLRRACRAAGGRLRSAPLQPSLVALVLAATLMTAIVAPPNSWDSMTYHMSRVAMWLQQGSLAHYPTAYLPQLYHPALNEWYMLHLSALADTDRFANASQWLALGGAAVAASQLAKELKAGFGVQMLAAVVAVALPMGVLQASSSLSDNVVAYWIAVAALFALQYLKAPTTARMIFCGLALGFALLSKGTAYPLALPIVGALFLYGIGSAKAASAGGKLMLAGLAIVAIAVLLNVGHYARNQALFGNPLVPDPESAHVNAQFGAAATFSNLVRNAALHLVVPSDRANALVRDALQRIFGDWVDRVPGTTIGVSLFERDAEYLPNEAYAANLLHFCALAATLCGVFLLCRRRRWRGWPVAMCVGIVLGAAAFCGTVQFSIYNSRMHTPLFFVGAPMIALFAAAAMRALRTMRFANRLGLDGPTRDRRLIELIAGVFFVAAVPWVACNVHRPMYVPEAYKAWAISIFASSRASMYFNARPALRTPYLEAAAFLAALEPAEVGLYMRPDDYDYPVHALLKEPSAGEREGRAPRMKGLSGKTPRISHVGVSNISSRLARDGHAPMYVFSTRGDAVALGGAAYRVIGRFPPVTILAREDAAHAIVGVPDQLLAGAP